MHDQAEGWQSTGVAKQSPNALARSLPERVERVIINKVSPQVQGGRLPAKAVTGEQLPVRACVFSDGQQELLVRARWRMQTDAAAGKWKFTQLEGRLDDFWTGNITYETTGAAEFQIEAWRNEFGSWRQGYRRWLRAGADPSLELPMGVQLLRTVLAWLPTATRDKAERRLRRAERGGVNALQNYLLSPGVANLAAEALTRTPPAQSDPFPVWVERSLALFGSWYEMFPRSQGAHDTKSGTLLTAQARLPALAEMHFDVVYLPPIHPIGTTARRGRNNAPVAKPGEPGSPWAIGSPAGGHMAVHPDLGTLADFKSFVKAAADMGLEVALDYALQCSPDHPWVKEHPDWFEHREDGSIRPAENPPKRYDDVFPLDFSCADWRHLWVACYEILEFWIAQGVRIFRVDNPHTKPVPFWAWVVERLREAHPDVIMLAEAFTRPALMGELSTVGFSQSYTYFTWRSTKRGLRSYLTQLTKETADYLRPNFFVNTPDILTAELQRGGAPTFRLRLMLAATLSPTYGIYSGYELFENKPQSRGSEEYWDSEKYQYRPRDWKQPGSLAPLIAQINQIRREHPALQQLRRLQFHRTDSPFVLAYSKYTADRTDVVLTVVNLEPSRSHRATIELSLRHLGPKPRHRIEAQDLLTGTTSSWAGPTHQVQFSSDQLPAQIYWIAP